MTLYEINEAILQVFTEHVDENGEITEQGLEVLSSLEMEKAEKTENVALWVKDLEAENSAIKAEIENLKSRIKTNENKIGTLKKWLAVATDGTKFSTPRCQVSFKTSTVVEILDVDKLPKDFTRIKTEVSPDKTKIKAVLQSGGLVDGAVLKKNNNTIVK